MLYTRVLGESLNHEVSQNLNHRFITGVYSVICTGAVAVAGKIPSQVKPGFSLGWIGEPHFTFVTNIDSIQTGFNL